MEITLKALPFSRDDKRADIDPKKLYLVKYSGIWLIGRFSMLWHGWEFYPNLGAMTMQIDSLDVGESIYEISGMSQPKAGDTASHVLSFLPEDDDDPWNDAAESWEAD